MQQKETMVTVGAVLVVVVVLINMYGQVEDLAARQDGLSRELEARHSELTGKLDET